MVASRIRRAVPGTAWLRRTSMPSGMTISPSIAAVVVVLCSGCLGDIDRIGAKSRPPARLDARWVQHNNVPPSKLPGDYGRGVDFVAQMLLAACWGVSDTPSDMTVVCHEERLDAEQAALLAGNRFAVFLPALRHLDPTAARALGTCSGVLDFSALESLDADAAALLAGRREIVRLPALRRLDVEAARGLAAAECDINLDGLTYLEPGVAAALGRHRGILTLNGLVELSADDARGLASHAGDLCLNGLRSLPADAAVALSRHGHGLHLNGLRTLSLTAATALAAHPGWCLSCNGLERLDERAIERLSKHARSGPVIAVACRLRMADSPAVADQR
jgi:hypothetical protein